MIILKIFCLYLITDFITGFFHFLLDQYGRPDSKLFKNAVVINLAHHANPRKITTRGYWELTKDSYRIGVVVLGFSLFFGFYWELWFVIILGAQANIIHSLSHRKKSENNPVVIFLQKIKLFQSSAQHRLHHKNPFDTYFCIMSDILNPLLEKINFWNATIKFFKLFGLHPVAGTSIRNQL